MYISCILTDENGMPASHQQEPHFLVMIPGVPSWFHCDHLLDQHLPFSIYGNGRLERVSRTPCSCHRHHALCSQTVVPSSLIGMVDPTLHLRLSARPAAQKGGCSVIVSWQSASLQKHILDISLQDYKACPHTCYLHYLTICFDQILNLFENLIPA